MTLPDPIVQIPVADLLRVTPFKGVDDIRYYLNGVLVTPYEDHALLVATNGHWMAIYESKDARTDAPRILDMPDWFLRQLVDTERGDPLDEEDEGGDYLPRTGSPTCLFISDEKAHLVIKEGISEVLVKPGLPFIDGKFPDWRKVLPDPATIEPGMIEPVAASYLSGLHKAVPFEREHALFAYHGDKAGGPVLFRFGNLPQLVIALMPRRDTSTAPEGWPQWMHKSAEEKAA